MLTFYHAHIFVSFLVGSLTFLCFLFFLEFSVTFWPYTGLIITSLMFFSHLLLNHLLRIYSILLDYILLKGHLLPARIQWLLSGPAIWLSCWKLLSLKSRVSFTISYNLYLPFSWLPFYLTHMPLVISSERSYLKRSTF